jgi:hypothetical protein
VVGAVGKRSSDGVVLGADGKTTSEGVVGAEGKRSSDDAAVLVGLRSEAAAAGLSRGLSRLSSSKKSRFSASRFSCERSYSTALLLLFFSLRVVEEVPPPEGPLAVSWIPSCI